MKNCVANQTVAALIRTAGLCVLAFLSAGSPAFAATFSHGVDVGTMLCAARLLLRPLGIVRDRLPFGNSARFSIDQIISLF